MASTYTRPSRPWLPEKGVTELSCPPETCGGGGFGAAMLSSGSSASSSSLSSSLSSASSSALSSSSLLSGSSSSSLSSSSVSSEPLGDEFSDVVYSGSELLVSLSLNGKML